MAGIIQEQHPDRARLFMQWKKMDWPILIDSLNLLEVSVVPLTLLIDEKGVIYAIQPDEKTFAEFLKVNSAHEPVLDGDGSSPAPVDLKSLAARAEEGEVASIRRYADALYLWGGRPRANEVISLYQQALQLDPQYGPTHFRLGVAYRSRYDSQFRRDGDFRKAVEHWGQALEMDPNQYIWRRRIQQYGPRLEKPYPFYDWVHQARNEIRDRGETPFPLSVEPGGAEFSSPAAEFADLLQVDSGQEPDPQGRIFRDSEGMIEVETVTVPARLKPGQSARVHVIFTPEEGKKAHWNNEVEGMKVWLSPPAEWQVDRKLIQLANPPQPVSQEVRKVEFEVQSPQNWDGSAVIPGYALYYVCEDVNGTCLYRRQDLQVKLSSAP